MCTVNPTRNYSQNQQLLRKACIVTAANSPNEEKQLIEPLGRAGAGALAHRQNGVQWAGSQKAGSIEIIIGPMFAGKTSALLQRIGEYEASFPISKPPVSLQGKPEPALMVPIQESIILILNKIF